MSVTTPKGFIATGGSMGIKPTGRPDVAIVASATGAPIVAAATFTTNLAAAAPVQWSRAALEATCGKATAVLMTSGNANAATGQAGKDAVADLATAVANHFGVASNTVLVGQTGLIGIPFPLAATSNQLPGVLKTLGGTVTDGHRAAEAIMTTDTFAKEVVVEGPGFSVGGMAKGAAMLAPNMATMLCVFTTDAAVEATVLKERLLAAVEVTFNRLLTDGARSTNDTVICLASGVAGPADPDALEAALTEACASLAEMMAEDAEGATKVIHLVVQGATDDAAAHAAARNVADSLLVKCSMNGEDPYWGRVVSELATAGVPFDLDRCEVSYGGITVCRGGEAVAHDAAAVTAHMRERHITLTCDLGLGEGAATMLTVDLGYGYIDENRTTS